MPSDTATIVMIMSLSAWDCSDGGVGLGTCPLLRLIEQFAHQPVELLDRGDDRAHEVAERLPLRTVALGEFRGDQRFDPLGHAVEGVAGELQFLCEARQVTFRLDDAEDEVDRFLLHSRVGLPGAEAARLAQHLECQADGVHCGRPRPRHPDDADGVAFDQAGQLGFGLVLDGVDPVDPGEHRNRQDGEDQKHLADDRHGQSRSHRRSFLGISLK